MIILDTSTISALGKINKICCNYLGIQKNTGKNFGFLYFFEIFTNKFCHSLNSYEIYHIVLGKFGNILKICEIFSISVRSNLKRIATYTVARYMIMNAGFSIYEIIEGCTTQLRQVKSSEFSEFIGQISRQINKSTSIFCKRERC